MLFLLVARQDMAILIVFAGLLPKMGGLYVKPPPPAPLKAGQVAEILAIKKREAISEPRGTSDTCG